MDNYPVVSLLVPAYKEEAVIESTLYHLVDEVKYPNKKIIVGIDGVEDETYEIVKSFSSKCDYLDIYISQRRQGIMPTMKTLISKAPGDILIKHDADRRFGNPDSCLYKIAKYFEEPQVGGIFFTGERDFEGSIFQYADDGYKGKILFERRKNLTSRAEAFVSVLVDNLRTSMFPFEGEPKYPIAIHCFRKSIFPSPENIVTDLIHDDVLFFYQTLDAGYKVVFAPDVIHWTYGGLPPNAKALYQQKIKGFIGWDDSSRRHGFSFKRYLFDIIKVFLCNFYKAKFIDILAFLYWSVIVAAAWIAARFKRGKSPKEVWTRFEREV